VANGISGSPSLANTVATSWAAQRFIADLPHPALAFASRRRSRANEGRDRVEHVPNEKGVPTFVGRALNAQVFTACFAERPKRTTTPRR
jgi:hypothetical protein